MPKLNLKATLVGLSVAYYLEALVLYVLTAASIWVIVTGDGKSPVTDFALVALTLGAGIWLTFAARAIVKGKRWARSAGVFWQLIQLVIAFGTYEASVIGALAITVPSVLVLLTLFNKQVVQATLENRD